MSTITLPNIRVSSDLTVKVSLKDGGVAIDWSTLSNIKAHIYSDAQRALAGRCSVAVDEEDATILVCTYAANKPQYVGVNRIVVSAKYMGEMKTYDKPAFNFVRWTDDQEGEEITIDDPDVDVEIEVEDVSSSILQEAIDAALQAAADAEEAAHLVPLQVLQDCVTATGQAQDATTAANAAADAANAAGITQVEASVDANVGTPSVDVDLTNKKLTLGFHNMKGIQGETGATPDISIGEVTTGAAGSQAAATMTGTAAAPVLNLTIPKGDKGDQGNSGYQGAAGELEVVNNLTDGGSTAALSAEMGKTLEGEFSQLEAEVDEKVDILPGKNLLNLDTVTDGSYIKTTGEFGTNASYSVSDFIKVEEGEDYYLSCLSGSTVMPLGTASACVNLYNSSKTLVSTVGGNSRTLTVPVGIAYIRVSIVNAYTDKQIEVGTARSTYEPYNPIGSYLSGVVSEIEDVKDDLVQLGQDVIPVDRTNSHTYTGNAIHYFWEDLNIKQGTKFILRIDGNATWGTNGAWIVSNLGTGLPGLTMVKATGEDHEITAPGDITKIGFRLYGYTTAGTITMRLIVPNSVYNLLAEKVEVKPGKNLYNEDANIRGCYLSSTGGITNSTSYSITDFIPVVPGQSYYCTGLRNGVANALGSSSAYAAYYDANRQFVSSTPGDDRGHTIPSGVSYMRLSVANDLTEVQIEVGAARSTYEQYTPIGGYPAKIPNGAVTMDKLSQGVQDAINAGGVPIFSSSRNSSTLAPTEILRVPLKCHIIKNALLVAKITGTIDKVSVGVGIKSDGTPNYQAYWAVIDQTNIKIYWYNNVEDTLVATYPHGITLTNKTTLWVDTSVGASQSVKLTLQDDLGNMFTQELSDWGMGVAFVRNDNTSGSLDIDLSFMPRDITKKIWLFGDSYFSYVSNAKWTYYLMADNLTDWLSNNLPGLSPASGYEDLESLLSLGHIPSYLVWCLGMNGATTEEQEGGVYVINPAQKEVIDNVLSVCQQYGITPVLATIPTVPTRQKTGFCNYVRSLGVRYIDFAEAVGTDSAGNWNTGLLSSDGVHPTSAGAKVLLTRALIDFPEIGIVD